MYICTNLNEVVRIKNVKLCSIWSSPKQQNGTKLNKIYSFNYKSVS